MSKSQFITAKQQAIADHPVFDQIQDMKSLKIFMSYHIFAVYDFMNLLKSLQRQLTASSYPWHVDTIGGTAMVRLINEIVLDEESDVLPDGTYSSHYEMYLQAMLEVGADTKEALAFVESKDHYLDRLTDLDCEQLATFLANNYHNCTNLTDLLASFLYSREDLIPQMFTSLIEKLQIPRDQAPTFYYYVERHIELDGDKHGPLLEGMLESLIEAGIVDRAKVEESALKALDARYNLWTAVSNKINSKEVETI